MNRVMAAVSAAASGDCCADRCSKEGCSISLAGAPAKRVIVDLDCPALAIPPDWKRCDYLFVGEDDERVWVSPIELKSGDFRAEGVVQQLRGGARLADRWIPAGHSFRFVPILAHGRGVHREQRKRLRQPSSRITLRGQTRQIELLRCRERLGSALDRA